MPFDIISLSIHSSQKVIEIHKKGHLKMETKSNEELTKELAQLKADFISLYKVVASDMMIDNNDYQTNHLAPEPKINPTTEILNSLYAKYQSELH